MKVAIVFALCLAYVVAKPTLETCKCWEGYTPKADPKGDVSCHGDLVFALKPCNQPQAPKCVCEKEKPTGILTDNEGTWCSVSDKGKLLKKWKCENEAAWAEYKIKSDEFDKEQKAQAAQ